MFEYFFSPFSSTSALYHMESPKHSFFHNIFRWLLFEVLLYFSTLPSFWFFTIRSKVASLFDPYIRKITKQDQ